MSDNEGSSELSNMNSRILANLHNEVHREKEPHKAFSDDDSELDGEGDSDAEIDAQGDDEVDEVDDAHDAQVLVGDSPAVQVLEEDEQLAQGENNAEEVEEGRQNKERDEPRRKNPKNISSDITADNIIGKQLRNRISTTGKPTKKGKTTPLLPSHY
jgi:hypothetical protein